MAIDREIGDVIVKLANGQEERYALKTTGSVGEAEAALTFTYEVTEDHYLLVLRHSVLVEGWDSSTGVATPRYTISGTSEVSRYRPDAWMSVKVE